jgi:NAD(P)-dependent dehydrogenase (short-subunit alcohol dehydrogenase family)
MRQNKISLDGATAIVTGGGRGLGHHLCLHLAGMGVHVAVTDIDAAAAADTVSRIIATGGSAEAQVFDVADNPACNECVRAVMLSKGKINLLIANAGMVAVGEFGDVPSRSFRRIMDVNFFGQLQMAQAVYRVMRTQKQGRIVFISSIAGLAFQPLTASYSASKHALVGLACSIFPDAASNNVSVHIACPGYIDETDIFNSAEAFGYSPLKIRDILLQRIAGFVKPDAAARKIIRDVLRNRFFIVFPFNAKLLGALFRLMPETTVRCSRFLERMVSSAKTTDATRS